MEKETVVGVAWWMWYEEGHLLNHRIIEKCFLIRLQERDPVSGIDLRNVTKKPEF